jgi:hypothetical protein
VLIVEGEKTADAAADLFPDHVVITSPGGSRAAGKADWSPLKGRNMAIWPDADEPGRGYATDLAKLAGKAGAERVVVVDVPTTFPAGWDLADAPPAGWDLYGLRRLLDEAAFGKDTPMPDFSSLLDEAAELDAVAYDRRRDELAEELGVRRSTLDAEVAKRRQDRQEEKRLFLVEPPGWEKPVEGWSLLDAMVAELRRYLVLPEHAVEAIALWVLHAHALDGFQCSPILALLSPEKRCGKTTALSVFGKIAPKAVFASNTSSAAIFRIIDKYQPTLLIDEADTFIIENDELRGVLNSGHQRSGAVVLRVSGDELEPRAYSTWSAKCIAMIGRLPGTLSDRAIEIQLQRKRADERVTRFRNVRPGNLPDLKRQCIRWAADNMISLRDMALDVVVPDGLNDRAADSWEPLLAIADRAGGHWPDRARKAALALSGNGAAEDGSIGVILLADIKAIFDCQAQERAAHDRHWNRIQSKTLAEKLALIEGRPWPDWKGKPITPNAVAKLLRNFAIAPKQLRFGSQNLSGYELQSFNDAFERYLSDNPSTTSTTATLLRTNGNSDFSNPTFGLDVGVQNPEKTNRNSDVGDVAVEPHAWEKEGEERPLKTSREDGDGGDEVDDESDWEWRE